MKFLAGLLALLVSFSALASPMTFQWTASTDTNVVGYALHISSSPLAASPYHSQYRYYTPNTNLLVSLPLGSWYAVVTAYSTNNSNATKIESQPSNEVMVYVPQSVTGAEVAVDSVYVPPIVVLSTNANLRVTTWLQTSTNLLNWSEGIPAVSFDVRASGLSGYFRTRQTVETLP